jgi:hypothetical protein
LKFKVFTLLFTLFLAHDIAIAAPQQSVKVLRTSFSIEPGFDVVGMLLDSKSVVLVGSRSGTAEISARSFDGTPLWKVIPPQANIALDIKSGLDGTYWVLGASEAIETKTAVTTPAIINPDSVVVTSPSNVSLGLRALNLWQISNSGQIINTITYINSAATLPRALSVSATGIAVVGDQMSANGRVGALWICTFSSCAAPLLIGSKNTSIQDIAHINNEIYLVGKSQDTISKLPLKGLTDGIVIRASTSGTIKSAMRSSLPKTDRSWMSITPNQLQGGVSLGKLSEACITQFNSKPGKFGQPVWSVRYPAKSTALTAGIGSVFLSTGGIGSLTNWKPKTPQLLLLTFDSKGGIKNATAINTAGSPVSFDYLNGLGYGVISSLSNTMYFTLVRE